MLLARTSFMYFSHFLLGPPLLLKDLFALPISSCDGSRLIKRSYFFLMFVLPKTNWHGMQLRMIIFFLFWSVSLFNSFVTWIKKLFPFVENNNIYGPNLQFALGLDTLFRLRTSPLNIASYQFAMIYMGEISYIMCL